MENEEQLYGSRDGQWTGTSCVWSQKFQVTFLGQNLLKMGYYTIFWMFENPRRGRQVRNRYFPKIDVGCPCRRGGREIASLLHSRFQCRHATLLPSEAVQQTKKLLALDAFQ